MVYVPLSVAKNYMENKWKEMGGRPETKSERSREILLQWYIWLGFYPTDYKSLMDFNNHLTEYYEGRFRAEVRCAKW